MPVPPDQLRVEQSSPVRATHDGYVLLPLQTVRLEVPVCVLPYRMTPRQADELSEQLTFQAQVARSRMTSAGQVDKHTKEVQSWMKELRGPAQ